jgi:hypothetical protein
MAVRLNQILAGGSGISPRVAEALAEALRDGAVPTLHRWGAIGTADLASLAELGLTLAGERPWRSGRGPVITIDATDALPMISSSALTVATAALALDGRAEPAAGLHGRGGAVLPGAARQPRGLRPRRARGPGPPGPGRGGRGAARAGGRLRRAGPHPGPVRAAGAAAGDRARAARGPRAARGAHRRAQRRRGEPAGRPTTAYAITASSTPRPWPPAWTPCAARSCRCCRSRRRGSAC